MNWIQTLADAALCVLAIQMVGYTSTYLIGSTWWTTQLGKTYATKSVLLTLVLIQNTISTLTDQDYPGRNWARLAIYTGGILAMQALWTILRRYQKHDKAKRRDD